VHRESSLGTSSSHGAVTERGRDNSPPIALRHLGHDARKCSRRRGSGATLATVARRSARLTSSDPTEPGVFEGQMNLSRFISPSLLNNSYYRRHGIRPEDITRAEELVQRLQRELFRDRPAAQRPDRGPGHQGPRLGTRPGLQSGRMERLPGRTEGRGIRLHLRSRRPSPCASLHRDQARGAARRKQTRLPSA
jgi:hypothetical protein